MAKASAKKKTSTNQHPALTEARALWERYEAEGGKPITEEVEALYIRVFGEPLKPCNCKDRIGDALIVIITHLKANNIIMSDRQYIMKRGVIIHWDGQTYSRINVTDQVAEEFSKAYPDADIWERKPAQAVNNTNVDKQNERKGITKTAEENKAELPEQA